MNIILIEDETRAANRLEQLILKIDPNFVILAKPESITEALSALSIHQQVDLIFSDIELGDGLSFEIFKTLNTDIPIIFTTAYNQYAIDAFKVNGIDYLLKPIQKEELELAITKFKKHQLSNNTLAQILQLNQSLQKEKPKYKSRFLLKIGTKYEVVPSAQISVFYSESKGTYLFTSQRKTYTLDESLGDIMEQLDPAIYFRISRKHIININYIHKINIFSNSRLILQIDGFDGQDLIVAREKVKEFKAVVNC